MSCDKGTCSCPQHDDNENEYITRMSIPEHRPDAIIHPKGKKHLIISVKFLNIPDNYGLAEIHASVEEAKYLISNIKRRHEPLNNSPVETVIKISDHE